MSKHLITRTCGAIDGIHYRNIYCAWFAGAGFLAHKLVAEMGCLRSLWGKGDEEKAMSLYEVCVCPMLSIWFRQVEQPRGISGGVLSQAKENAIFNMLSLIGTYSEAKARDAMNLDRQYNYERDLADTRKDIGVSTWYATLLIAKLKEAWEARKILDWDNQSFPIIESKDYKFVGQASVTDIIGHSDSQLTDILLLATAWIPQCGSLMLDSFNEMSR